MTNYARAEREALCDTFLRVGPDAPTLCSPWTTADLAAHLVVRESRPDLSAGLVVPFLAGRLDRGQRDLATKTAWPELVDMVRQGPPSWSPVRLGRLDEMMNTIEFFVHHEDVLRGGEEWVRRDLTPGHERVLWATVTRMGKLLARRAPTGVVVVSEGYGRAAIKGPGVRDTVVVRGRPGEVILFLYGRQRVAEVEMQGPPSDISALQSASMGF